MKYEKKLANTVLGFDALSYHTSFIRYKRLKKTIKLLAKEAGKEDVSSCTVTPGLTCSICGDDIDRAAPETSPSGHLQTACSHSFHKRCLSTWLARCNSLKLPDTCPCCRQEVSFAQLSALESSNYYDAFFRELSFDARSVDSCYSRVVAKCRRCYQDVHRPASVGPGLFNKVLLKRRRRKVAQLCGELVALGEFCCTNYETMRKITKKADKRLHTRKQASAMEELRALPCFTATTRGSELAELQCGALGLLSQLYGQTTSLDSSSFPVGLEFFRQQGLHDSPTSQDSTVMLRKLTKHVLSERTRHRTRNVQDFRRAIVFMAWRRGPHKSAAALPAAALPLAREEVGARGSA